MLALVYLDTGDEYNDRILSEFICEYDAVIIMAYDMTGNQKSKNFVETVQSRGLVQLLRRLDKPSALYIPINHHANRLKLDHIVKLAFCSHILPTTLSKDKKIRYMSLLKLYIRIAFQVGPRIIFSLITRRNRRYGVCNLRCRHWAYTLE